jgi:sensor histidine kinase regulating citrate/malate metabolism
MVKNALEASKAGQEVKIKCTSNDSETIFYVNNPGYMERNVQLQIFQRSFSSKGAGRGLGTYSIKLLTERYLKGTVGFTSDKEKGTTFFIKLPPEIKS